MTYHVYYRSIYIVFTAYSSDLSWSTWEVIKPPVDWIAWLCSGVILLDGSRVTLNYGLSLTDPEIISADSDTCTYMSKVGHISVLQIEKIPLFKDYQALKHP